MDNPVLQQHSFRGRNDDGSESTATWKGLTVNNNWTQNVDENFRVRFLVKETAGIAKDNYKPQLQYNRNGDGWFDVNELSSIVRASDSPNLTDGEDTTQQVGSGTFVSPNDGVDEVNGTAGGTVCDFVGNDECEFEYCAQIRSADVDNLDTIELRLVSINTYTETPIVTVSEAGGNDPISGTIAAVATFSGTMIGKGALSGTIAVTSVFSGPLIGIGVLLGTIAAVATFAATGRTFSAISGTIAASSAFTGTLLGTGALSGTIAGVATFSGSLIATGVLEGTIPAVATFSGPMIGKGALEGTIAAVATFSGPLIGIGEMVGTIAAVGTFSGALVGQGALEGTIVANAVFSGPLIGKGAIAGTIVGAAAFTGTMIDVGVKTGQGWWQQSHGWLG